MAHTGVVDEELLVSGEHIVAVIRKHPIGLVFLYLQALAGVVAALTLFFFAAPGVFANLDEQVNRAIVGVVILGIAFLVIYLFVATYIYHQSRLLVTDKNLIQISQKSLFIRKVSRLSFSNVEDVSSDMRGILSTIFNYGTLLIQTAGERPNFDFRYCPTPNRFADQILEARQAYAESLKEVP